MIKSLGITPTKSKTKVGSVQSQTKSPSAKSTNSVSEEKSSTSSKQLTVSNEPIRIKTASVTKSIQSSPKMSIVKNVSLNSLIGSIVSNESVLSGLKSPISRLVPGYFLSLDKLTLTKTPVDSFKQSTKKFELHETLTSISSERPEIVMMSTFQPIYHIDNHSSHSSLDNDDQFLTDAGRFLEAQTQLRFLRSQNIFKMLSTVRKTKKAQKEFIERSEKFTDTISDLSSTIDYFLSVLNRLESVKSHLDLRNKIHDTDPSEFSSNHAANFSGISDNELDLISNFNITDVLVKFGFEKDSVFNTYSSTKIWMQLLYEFKQICHSHSLSLVDADTSPYKNDKNPVIINKPKT